MSGLLKNCSSLPSLNFQDYQSCFDSSTLIIIGISILLLCWVLLQFVPNIVSWLSKRAKDAGKFIIDHENFIDFLFIMLFAVEQFLLIVLLTCFDLDVNLVVSIFALVVITTASIQKLISDIKSRRDKALIAARTAETDQMLSNTNRETEKWMRIALSSQGFTPEDIEQLLLELHKSEN